MADIAAIFHWSHAELAAMTLPDLMRWQNLAVAWWNETNKAR